MTKLDALLKRSVEKKRLSADDADAAMGRIKPVEGDGTGQTGALGADTELVIEVSTP